MRTGAHGLRQMALLIDTAKHVDKNEQRDIMTGRNRLQEIIRTRSSEPSWLSMTDALVATENGKIFLILRAQLSTR